MVRILKTIFRKLCSVGKDSIVTRLYLSFILFALFVNCIFFIVVNYQTKNAAKQIGYDNIPQRVLTKEDVIKDFLKHANDTLIAMRQSKIFNQYLQNPRLYEEELNEYFLTITRSNHSIMQFRYLDKNGLENIKIDRIKEYQNPFVISKDKLQDKSKRYYFYESKNKTPEKVWLSDLDLNMEHGKVQTPFNPTVRAVLPIEKDGVFDGILIINFFMETIVKELTYLPLYDYKVINKRGELIVSSDPDESWGKYKTNPISIKDIYPKEYTNILKNKLYRGDDFISKELAIDLPSPLIMILKVKQEYINNASNSLIVGHLIQGIFIFLASLLVAYFFARQMKKVIHQYNKDIKIKTEELQEKDKNLNEHVLYSRTDLRGIITDASQVFSNLSGYSKKELIGSPHNIVRHPDMDPEVFKEIWETIKSKKVWKGEIKNRSKDGGFYWVEAMISPEYDKDLKHIGYVSIRHDITAKKNFEEQQTFIQEQAKMAAMGEMIGNIAHQWRQPLSAISVLATGASYKKELGLLEDTEFFESMEKINNSTKYLSDTIDTFRDFLQANKEKEHIELFFLLKESISIIADTLVSNYIKIKNNITENSSVNIELYIAKHEFQQVILNLLNNAKDILMEKKIDEAWIEVDAIKKDDQIIITVEDNGGGIPDDIMPKIFEPYFTTKHKSQGTGLGLHMSYKIIKESIGGEIYANNTKNGAKFYLEIPIN